MVDRLEEATFWADGGASGGGVAWVGAGGSSLDSAPLAESFDSFRDAASGASALGLVLVEEAIDKAIAAIDEELAELRPEEFEVEAFIPLIAFGAADRSPEVAVHHTRAHAVMTATLVGVRSDLEHFKMACELARRDITQVDEDLWTDLTRFRRLLDDIGVGLTNHSDQAYEDAMDDVADIGLGDTAHAPGDDAGGGPQATDASAGSQDIPAASTRRI